MFLYDKGIQLVGSKLWLDASRKVAVCCVSHAHMDHAKKHEHVIATKPTLSLLKKRTGLMQSTALEYKEPFHYEDCIVRFYPAGHILGSAQVQVEANGRRLLYSGDFNMTAGITAEDIEIPESDILIMESTFGKPRYRFPPREQVAARLIAFVEQTLQDNCVPVVLGYALGKAQEAMKILGDAGFKLSVHGSIAVLAETYEDNGVDFGDWIKFNKKYVQDRVLIFPRHVLQNRILDKIPDKRTVFLSGWAVNSGLKYRYGLDEAIPLSDHADFDGLIEYVRHVNPEKVFTTHGFDEFPYHLRAAGFDAELLSKPRQLSLF